ncbi:MAG: bifunctional oligoribonuclease/PAP phosphatase NrnA [Candidatus Magasanikbacteria bacterium]
MPKRTSKQIFNTILRAKKILLVPHQNPDGDALGSVTAMMQFLRTLEKPHTAYCKTDISERLRFLPHADYISQDDEIWNDTNIDVIMVFDSGDLEYAGVREQIENLKHKPTIINIDHHKRNDHFGDLNLVLPHAPSTTSILFQFFAHNEIHVDQSIATCLLTGLVTDTDNFTNAATTAQSLTIGSDLISRGANLHLIKGWTLKDKTIAGLKLWGIVMQRLDRHEELDIVFTYVTQEDIRSQTVTESEIEGFANFLNTLEDGKAGMILKEHDDGSIKGSFRTNRDDVDVSSFAKLFGGGGHQKAAGFTISGPMEQAIPKIFNDIEKMEKSTSS